MGRVPAGALTAPRIIPFFIPQFLKNNRGVGCGAVGNATKKLSFLSQNGIKRVANAVGSEVKAKERRKTGGYKAVGHRI